MGRVILKSIACVALSLLFLQSVCGLHTEDDLHQCGWFHLPGSVWEGPPHLAIAARPLRPSRVLTWWRGSRESVSGSSTHVPRSPLPSLSLRLHAAAGPPETRGTPGASGEESSAGLIALPRVLHSCSSVPCGLSFNSLNSPSCHSTGSLVKWSHTQSHETSNGASLLFNVCVRVMVIKTVSFYALSEVWWFLRSPVGFLFMASWSLQCFIHIFPSAKPSHLC